jgi:hypothetical protein
MEKLSHHEGQAGCEREEWKPPLRPKPIGILQLDFTTEFFGCGSKLGGSILICDHLFEKTALLQKGRKTTRRRKTDTPNNGHTRFVRCTLHVTNFGEMFSQK